MNWAKIQEAGFQRKLGKKRKKSKKKAYKYASKTEFYAMELNTNVPKSEQWFRELYKPYLHTQDFDCYKDQYNGVVGNMIVDLVNRKFKYAVEIDGSFHDIPEQKHKDRMKDAKLALRGYKVFRVPAYNETKFKEVLEQILSLRNDSAL